MKNIITAMGITFLLCGNVNAQQLTTQIDKYAMNEFNVSYWPYELDGNPNTREWLGMRESTPGAIEYSVVRVNGNICKGPWFNPNLLLPVLPEFDFYVYGLINRGDKWVWIAQGFRYIHVIEFVMPTTCRP